MFERRRSVRWPVALSLAFLSVSVGCALAAIGDTRSRAVERGPVTRVGLFRGPDGEALAGWLGAKDGLPIGETPVTVVYRRGGWPLAGASTPCLEILRDGAPVPWDDQWRVAIRESFIALGAAGAAPRVRLDERGDVEVTNAFVDAAHHEEASGAIGVAGNFVVNATFLSLAGFALAYFAAATALTSQRGGEAEHIAPARRAA